MSGTPQVDTGERTSSAEGQGQQPLLPHTAVKNLTWSPGALKGGFDLKSPS
jgi:hypothetical protein